MVKHLCTHTIKICSSLRHSIHVGMDDNDLGW